MGGIDQSAVTMLTEITDERVSDTTLVARSLADPEAFAALFDRHAALIHRYAARRLGAEAADDVMAETFAVAFQRRRDYDLERVDARPWLYGIATNLIRNHRRAEARRWRAMARDVAGAGAEPEPEADGAAARVTAQAARGELARVLAGLPSRQRDVLLLYAWADLEYEEIAQALGLPVGTVRSRLHRARAAMKEGLPWTS
jgi:RNA polymerase sigma factor (sigma-70 family)